MESTSTVMTALTVGERADKADEMASLIAQIDGIKAQAKAKAFEFRSAVDALQDQLSEIANKVRFGMEEKLQGELKFDPPTFEAMQALHAAGKAACSCVRDGDAEPAIASVTCPVHGVDSRGENPPTDGPEAPTHRCLKCGALWRREGDDDNHTWHLTSPTCGECCDNAAEADAALAPIEAPATDEEIAEDVAAVNDAEGEEERVVDMAAHLRANAVDVGTVEEPETAKAHRARRARG